MSAIRVNEIKNQIKEVGAKETANRLAAALKSGDLTISDMPSVRTLYECFVHRKGADREIGYGNAVLTEQVDLLTEEAANLTSVDAFNVITSQIYFNALTTRYNSADFNVSPLFRVIPSNIVSGEKFGGISNINTVLQPTPFGRELPALEPTQDYTMSAPMLQTGALVDINMPMMRADATGEIMSMFEKLGETLGTSRELEAVATLTDLASTRTRLNWKGSSYATYQSSTPWVNVVGSNALLTPQSINAAYQALQNITDPYTGLPVATPPGELTLICTPELLFTANRIKHGVEYRTGGSSGTDFNPTLVSTAQVPEVTFNIVASKYLKYWNDANSGTNTTWYLGYPGVAFSWQQMYPITVSEALPNAGDMFRRNIAASYKAFRIETAFAFNPRYMVKNTVAA